MSSANNTTRLRVRNGKAFPENCGSFAELKEYFQSQYVEAKKNEDFHILEGGLDDIPDDPSLRGTSCLLVDMENCTACWAFYCTSCKKWLKAEDARRGELRTFVRLESTVKDDMTARGLDDQWRLADGSNDIVPDLSEIKAYFSRLGVDSDACCETLGCLKSGDGIAIAEDGTISLDNDKCYKLEVLNQTQIDDVTFNNGTSLGFDNAPFDMTESDDRADLQAQLTAFLGGDGLVAVEIVDGGTRITVCERECKILPYLKFGENSVSFLELPCSQLHDIGSSDEKDATSHHCEVDEETVTLEFDIYTVMFIGGCVEPVEDEEETTE